MDILKKEIINGYTKEIRKNMNDIIEEIDGDFSGWCELASMLMFRLVGARNPSWDNKVAIGYYNGNGHYWNIIEGHIVDVTVDQFGRIKTGVVNKKWVSKYKIKEFINFEYEDLIHMTKEVYDIIC